MLVLEDLISKMKIHFPRWMDIRRKINTSSGGQLLYSIGENIEEINVAITEYKKDFFIDEYIGKEDEVLTYLYKYHIGTIELDSLNIVEPKGYLITKNEKEFHKKENMIYYNDGFLYAKNYFEEIEYSIDEYKSVVTPEKIHVWNIFDEFAAFIGIRRFLWESNSELVNRIFSFANKKTSSTNYGLKHAIINTLTNIDNSILYEDITIERPTPENLNKYYDNFEIVLDHLANINRDVYRTKRWDLDTWNFDVKSVDYIPHAWDVILNMYTNGIGFEDDLKVQIVDAEMKTDATIYFYKKTLEYINSYIKNNNIKEKIKLDLVRHNENLIPTNVKYRVTSTELSSLMTDDMFAESYDYKIGNITQTVNDIFDEQEQDYKDVEIKDTSKLDHNKKYKLRFLSLNELEEMSIENLYILNTKTNQIRDILIDKPGFKKISEHGIKCSLTKEYISELYHFSNVENIHKDLNGFVISDVQKDAILSKFLEDCHNENIYYEYYCNEVPVLYQNIKRHNCYIKNDSILSDTVSGEKYIELNIEANSFSCNIHGSNKIIYSINGETPKIKTNNSTFNETFTFKIDASEKPRKMKIKIILNPIEGLQCAITDIMYSHYSFEISTEKGELLKVGGQYRLPNFNKNNLIIKMKTWTGFSPVLKYVYIGTKVKNIVYGDIEITPEENDIIVMKKNNCLAELETLSNYSQDEQEDFRTDSIDTDYTASKVITSISDDSYIEINLSNFKKYKKVQANNCYFESIFQGSQTKNIIKIPNGIMLKEINIIGEYEKLLFRESLSLILKRKGFNSQNYLFQVNKLENKILASEHENYSRIKFIQINRVDLNAYNAAKVKFIMPNERVSAVFIENGVNKTSEISNECFGQFDYVAFYPTHTKIYKAINEYDVISPITIVPEIINTFDNNYSTFSEDVMYSKIESLNDKYDVTFKMDKELLNYSTSKSEIQITKKDMQDMNFEFDPVTITYDTLMSNSIKIPDSVYLNGDNIEISKYMIMNKDLDIVYLNKYSDLYHSNDYVITEIISVSDLRCNKLKYCNINEIESIYISSSKIKLEPIIDFNLKNKEGILHWINDEKIANGEKIFIKYNINKAKFIKISMDKLYEKVNYTTNAYELLNKVSIYEIKNKSTINLEAYNDYKKSDLISIKCSNIGFEALVNNNIITFEKNLKNNTIAVKSGFYYLDGDEYYLFADEYKNNIEYIDDLSFFNVIKENKKLYFNQTTTNKISNSSLSLNAKGTMFNLDCKEKNINSVSKINSITTCNSFNYWKSVGANMSIVKGLNGLGIKFENIKNFKGYSYLDISNHMPYDNKNYTISFYMKGDGQAFLGEEKRIFSQSNEFNKKSIIEIKKQAVESLIEDNIFELDFKNMNNKRFHLIIQGDVVIDDILIQESDSYDIDNHKKNISTLNLDIEENIYANYETRLYLNDIEGSIFEGTEFKDDKIINSSHIDWGFTKTYEISTYSDFNKCELENVDLVKLNNTCYLTTDTNVGKLISNPIYIGNINTIKNIMFKINDVMFDNMKNFKVTILSSPNSVTGFNEISTHLDNIGTINSDILSSYIKIVVEMPHNKVIDNIELYTEYLSDEVYNPPEIPVVSGNYISKVLDTQYNTRYIIKKLNYELSETSMNNIVFSVRASKENAENTVWTDWKQLKFLLNEKDEYYLDSRIVFDGYRYFQFKVLLKGANSSVKIKSLDLEVI